MQSVQYSAADIIHGANTGHTHVAGRLGIVFLGQILVEVHQRTGLRLIHFQTLADGFFLVVITLNQFFTGFIVLVVFLRRKSLNA